MVEEARPEFDRLVTVKWISSLASSMKPIRKLLEDEATRKALREQDFITKLIGRRDDVRASTIKIAIFYYVILLSLFGTIIVPESDVRFFQFTLENIETFRDFLILVLATMGIYTAIAEARYRYLNELARVCVEELEPKNAHEFYEATYMFKSDFSRIFSLPRDGNVFPHASTTVVYLIFLLVMFMLGIILFGSAAGMYFVVLLKSYQEPVTPIIMNRGIITFSVLSLVFSLLTILIQGKVPTKDYSNLDALDELEQKNPEAYQSVLGKIATRSARIDFVVDRTVASTVFLVMFGVLSAPRLINQELDPLVFVMMTVLGTLTVGQIAGGVVAFINSRITRWFVKSADNDAHVFAKSERTRRFIRWTIRLAFPAILTSVFFTG